MEVEKEKTMCGVLAQKALEMSPFFRVPPGESVSAVYKGFRIVDSRLDPGKQLFRYILEVDGKEKFFDNSKMAIAFVLDKAGEGDIIEISNSGTIDKGNYAVKILVGQNMDTDSDKKPTKK